MLRERMGLGWPIAALAAAIVIAIAGALFLRAWVSPPPPPWVAAGRLTAVEPGGAGVLAAPGLEHGALIVRAAGDVRAFAAPPVPLAYCVRSGHVESPEGGVWGLDGRQLGPGSGDSLQRVPVRVFDGMLYVNPTIREQLPARPGAAEAAC